MIGMKKNGLPDRSLNLLFPELTRGDRLFILPEPKGFRRAAELAAQLSLDALALGGKRTLGIFVVLTRIAKEPDKLRQFR